MVCEIEKPISDLLQNHRFRESSDGGDCCTVNQTVAILETVLKRLRPRFTAIVTSFENMMVSPLDDCLRCVAIACSRRAKSSNESKVRIPQSRKQSLGKSKLSLPCCAPTGFCAKR